MKERDIAACAIFVAHAAVAQTQLPEDVARYVERRDACDHFRGEEPYDAQRRAFLEQKMIEFCVGSDKRLAELKKKYRGEKAVAAKLGTYEVQIEATSPK